MIQRINVGNDFAECLAYNRRHAAEVLIVQVHLLIKLAPWTLVSSKVPCPWKSYTA